MPNLDFVRSVAVISVVVEHTMLACGILQIGPFPIPYLGVLGVMVFFVLTALVLMWSLERRPNPLDFYIRRVFRIYPLVIVTILAAVALHAPVAGTVTNYFQYQHPSVRAVLVHMALVQNLVAADGGVMGVLWSLPFEVQMYILLPFLFFFVRRNSVLWPLLLLWALIVMVGRKMSAESAPLEIAVGYFLPGVMAYVGFERWKPRLPGWLLPIFLFGLWALFLPRCNFHKGWWFCLIVGLSLPLFRQMTSRPVVRISGEIAKYSYGVYLMHPFAIVCGFYLLRGHSLPVRVLGEVVPLLVLPVLAYHLVEHPMIRVGSRIAARAGALEAQREQQAYRQIPG